MQNSKNEIKGSKGNQTCHRESGERVYDAREEHVVELVLEFQRLKNNRNIFSIRYYEKRLDRFQVIIFVKWSSFLELSPEEKR